MLTVKNKGRTIFTLNLAKGEDYEDDKLAAQKTTLRLSDHAPDGTLGVRLVEKELPASITWLAGETKSKLPEKLAELPDFQRARDAGILLVVEQPST